MTRTKTERWWHVYIGACDHMGGTIVLTLGESTMHPEQLVTDRDRLTLKPDMGCECQTAYLRSYDHEPTKAERDWIESRLEDLFADRWRDDE